MREGSRGSPGRVPPHATEERTLEFFGGAREADPRGRSEHRRAPMTSRRPSALRVRAPAGPPPGGTLGATTRRRAVCACALPLACFSRVIVGSAPLGPAVTQPRAGQSDFPSLSNPRPYSRRTDPGKDRQPWQSALPGWRPGLVLGLGIATRPVQLGPEALGGRGQLPWGRE